MTRRSTAHLLLSVGLVVVLGRLLGGLSTDFALPRDVPSESSDSTATAAAMSRRSALLPAVIPVTLLASSSAGATEVELPEKIKEDPFALIGVTDPDSEKQDKASFTIRKKYKEDTLQMIKHMKISGSLDKGAPNMERFNIRVKEEINDYVAMYRRQDSAVGRQSWGQLYSAINALASHFTSYGPKFPFPNKRRPRFYQLIASSEKYLAKGK